MQPTSANTNTLSFYEGVPIPPPTQSYGVPVNGYRQETVRLNMPPEFYGGQPPTYFNAPRQQTPRPQPQISPIPVARNIPAPPIMGQRMPPNEIGYATRFQGMPLNAFDMAAMYNTNAGEGNRMLQTMHDASIKEHGRAVVNSPQYASRVEALRMAGAPPHVAAAKALSELSSGVTKYAAAEDYNTKAMPYIASQAAVAANFGGRTGELYDDLNVGYTNDLTTAGVNIAGTTYAASSPTQGGMDYYSASLLARGIGTSPNVLDKSDLVNGLASGATYTQKSADDAKMGAGKDLLNNQLQMQKISLGVRKLETQAARLSQTVSRGANGSAKLVKDQVNYALKQLKDNPRMALDLLTRMSTFIPTIADGTMTPQDKELNLMLINSILQDANTLASYGVPNGQ